MSNSIMISDGGDANYDQFYFPKRQTNHWLDKSKRKGFPQDDETSLMQYCGDCCNLDIFYKSQFVQAEKQSYNSKEALVCYMLEYTPVLPGTLAGTIYVGRHAVQRFYHTSSGRLMFDKIGDPEIFVVESELKPITGELLLTFNKVAEMNAIEVNYEFDMEPNDQ